MNSVLLNMLYFSVAVVLAKIFGTFTQFFVAKFLSPAHYGWWGTLTFVASYAAIFCFGTVEALIKQYPYHMGRGEVDKAREVEESVLGSIWIAAGLVFIVTIIAHFTIKDDSVRFLKTIIWLISAATMVGMFCAFYYHRFTAWQYFKMVSIYDTLNSIANFLFLIVLSYLWGLLGTAIGFFLSTLV
ncbi:MAG: oligosaccharide flippase family protein, partial [Chitinivibrionales bacterium]|nr:oligosaccharide flippase family protein [Chitinivibrionales bacterium]